MYRWCDGEMISGNLDGYGLKEQKVHVGPDCGSLRTRVCLK